MKPATLRAYDSLLAEPGGRPRQGGPRAARIMKAFGKRRLAEITAADIERFLRGLDREGLSGRNVNVHRQILTNVFEYAIRPDTFALASNPARSTEKRREEYTKPPDTFTAEQVLAIARAARDGQHVKGGRRWASQAEGHEQQKANAQDAALYTVAGFTGLRQGATRAALEACPVRRSDPGRRRGHVRRGGLIKQVRNGERFRSRVTPSSRWTNFPSESWFTDPDEYVFCGPAGDPLDDSALRRRSNRCRDAAGLPPLPFHHLRDARDPRP